MRKIYDINWAIRTGFCKPAIKEVSHILGTSYKASLYEIAETLFSLQEVRLLWIERFIDKTLQNQEILDALEGAERALAKYKNCVLRAAESDTLENHAKGLGSVHCNQIKEVVTADDATIYELSYGIRGKNL